MTRYIPSPARLLVLAVIGFVITTLPPYAFVYPVRGFLFQP
jgi:hypothetical protein